MEEVLRVRVLGQAPMTERDYKIYKKRKQLISEGKTEELTQLDAKLAQLDAKLAAKKENKEEAK